MNKKLKWYFCIHHQIIVESAIEPIKNRINFIKENKPEYQQKMRLKCLKKVKGELPKEIVKAEGVYRKAWAVFRKAEGVYDKERDVFRKAEGVYDKERDVFRKAGGVYDKERDVFRKAVDVYGKAVDVYHKTLNKHKKELLEMLAEECPECKFNWEKGIIFEGA